MTKRTGFEMFEELLKEIKETLENTEYVVIVPVPYKKLWEDLCDTLESTGFASFANPWTIAKKEYWEEYKDKTVMCFKEDNCVILSYFYRSYYRFSNNKVYKFLNIPINTPKCLRRL